MIDVLKRLAELDANNPNIDGTLPTVKADQGIVVKESSIEECGMMGGMMPPPMPSHPPIPAQIHIEAGSGEEITDMLATLMHLSGQATGHDTGDDHHDDGMTADDDVLIGAPSMRQMIDKLNPDMDKVDEVDNEPADPTNVPAFDPEEFAHQENQPGQGDRMDGTQPKAYPDMSFESLMAEYQKFLQEDSK